MLLQVSICPTIIYYQPIAGQNGTQPLRHTASTEPLDQTAAQDRHRTAMSSSHSSLIDNDQNLTFIQSLKSLQKSNELSYYLWTV